MSIVQIAVVVFFVFAIGAIYLEEFGPTDRELSLGEILLSPLKGLAVFLLAGLWFLFLVAVVGAVYVLLSVVRCVARASVTSFSERFPAVAGSRGNDEIPALKPLRTAGDR